MSTNRSRPAAAGKHRRPDRRRFLVAALCALSCFGVGRWYFGKVLAQEKAEPSVAPPTFSPPQPAATPGPEVASPAAPPAASVPSPSPQASTSPPAATPSALPSAAPAAPPTPDVNTTEPPAAEPAQKGTPGAAATPDPVAPKKGESRSLDELLEQPGTLVLVEGSLAQWLLAIQQTWGVDMIYDSAALQREFTTGQFTRTPLKNILDTILSAKGYGYRREQNVLVIHQREEGDSLPNQKRAMIRMEYVTPQEVEPSVKLLLSPKGQQHSIPSAKTLMIVDYPDNIERIKEHIAELDQFARQSAEKNQSVPPANSSVSPTPGPDEGSTVGPVVGPIPQNVAPDVLPVERIVTTTLWPRFVLADNLVDAVTQQIGDGTVTAVPDLNALVVSGTESAVQTATQLVKELDVIKKQVRITVLMYDIDIESLEQLGINWRHAGKGRIGSNGIPSTFGDLHSAPLNLGVSSSTTGSTSGSSSSSTSSGATSGTSSALGLSNFATSAAPNLVGSALTLQHFSRHFDLSAVFMALDQTDGARLLASPSVLCYDRKPTEMKIISEIPVQELTQTDQGGNIGTTTFREAGVTLTVTPSIGENGIVLLTVAPEFSVLTGFQAGQPIIDRRQHTGTVAVQSGDTLVLGGLRRRNELETVSGIPGLMNWKYVGALFRSHRTTIEESELITFIRTEIVDTCYGGTLREQVAAQIVDETLDRIPIAGHSPYVPPCNDPYCPIHNPRPKYWQGNMLSPEPLPPGYSGSAPPYLQPRHQHPLYETLPPVDGERIPGGQPMLPPVPPSAEDAIPPHENPPPVQIDENARKKLGNRIVLYRLPKVNAEPGSPVHAFAPEGTMPPGTSPRMARIPQVPPVPGAPPSASGSAPPARQAPPTSGGTWQQLFR